MNYEMFEEQVRDMANCIIQRANGLEWDAVYSLSVDYDIYKCDFTFTYTVDGDQIIVDELFLIDDDLYGFVVLCNEFLSQMNEDPKHFGYKPFEKPYVEHFIRALVHELEKTDTLSHS